MLQFTLKKKPNTSQIILDCISRYIGIRNIPQRTVLSFHFIKLSFLAIGFWILHLFLSPGPDKYTPTENKNGVRCSASVLLNLDHA